LETKLKSTEKEFNKIIETFLEIERVLPMKEKEMKEFKKVVSKEEESLEIIENKVHAKSEKFRVKKSEIE